MSAGPVLITGLGALTPIGADVPTFAAALREGRCGIQVVADPDAPDQRRLLAPLTDPGLAAMLDGVEGLDPVRHKRFLRIARRSPFPVRAALTAAVQAWQDAELATLPVPRDRIGIVVGGHNLTGHSAFELYPTYLRQPAHVPPRFALQAQDTDHVGTISEALGIEGEGCTVGASSASGNAALIHAARLVQTGEVDVCLAVGALARLGPLEVRSLANLGASALVDTACRPFDRRRAGFVPGEAAACVVVESQDSAVRRGIRTDAVVELAGAAMVLAGTSLSDPSRASEVRAMAGALARAGIGAERIDYINAHATGTPAGDDVEIDALIEVFGDGAGAGAGDGAAAAQPWVNATKALIGHCLSAAGVVEAVAAVVQMRGGFVHPNPVLADPVTAGLRLVGTSAQPAAVEYALSNSFGFGGFNSSVVLRRA